MNKLAQFIVRRKAWILAVFAVMIALNGFFATRVTVNFDIFSYVPEEAPSTIAIDTMDQEYEQSIPNAEVAIPNMTIREALAKKKELQNISVVDEVLWLDDVCDLALPLDLLDQRTVEAYFKDGWALYQITITDNTEAEAVLAELHAIAGDDGAVRGEIAEMANMQRGVTVEISSILSYAVPIAFIILLFATSSYWEPVLFLFVIFAGVLFNVGSNAFLPSVSFITQAVGTVLQLAVSMDYAIFLLHRFSEYRAEGMTVEAAMQQAIVKSFAPVSSSALTTFFGFLMLIFMRFRIGADLGLVLAKGVVLSLVSVFFLLPVLALYTYKIIDKTTHRPFLPSFGKFGHFVVKIGVPVMIIFAVMVVPAFIFQRSNHFLYGSRTYPRGSREARDVKIMDDVYGDNMQMVCLVPKGDWATEEQLVKELDRLPEMKSTVGYVSAVGTGVPSDVLPDSQLSALLSEHYSRIIMIADSPDERPETFELAEQIRGIVDKWYPEGDTHLAGMNFVLLDMRDTVQQDLIVVNGLAILAIFLVIVFTFRSFALPLILVLTIELSIWINLAIPYLTHTPLNFIGYLVVSTVQLGATVDYGILMAQHYLDHRRTLPKKEAAIETVHTVAGSIIPPALILGAVGFILYFVSSIQVVGELGHVLGRGALLSLFTVLFLLPNLLRLFDGFIEKTTRKVTFLPDRRPWREKKQA
ncbi:MAG: efflux RND transporter permease subunit [Saccharofermentanales bacterium]|jgi:predicted RND superfamily exporter protein